MTGSITTEVDQERDLTIYTVRGAFTAEQAGEAIQSFYEGEPTFRVLWDLTEADFSNISATVPQHLAAIIQRHGGTRTENGMTALVVSSDVGFGLGRMFETFRDLQNAAVEYRTFRQLDEALVWLGL